MLREVRTLRTAEQSARGIRERFILRLDPSRSSIEDREQLGRSADHLVDFRELSIDSALKPFVAYQREVGAEVLVDSATSPQKEEKRSVDGMDDDEFWSKIAELGTLDRPQAQFELSNYEKLLEFGSRVRTAAAAIAVKGLPNTPQLHDVAPGSDSLAFWCAAVLFSGKQLYDQVLHGEPVALDEQTWADGELYLAVVEGALKDRFGADNPSFAEGSGSAESIDSDTRSAYDQIPVTRSMVGIWFVIRLPSGALAECVGVFAQDVFDDLASQARAAAVWLAKAQGASLVSPVEAFDTSWYEPFDGLEIFTTRRKWKGSLDDYLLQRGLVGDSTA